MSTLLELALLRANRRASGLGALTSLAMFVVAVPAQGSIATIPILDIGTFTSYQTPDVGQSYAGTGFVGLYNFGGIQPEFGHLFGLEDSNFSRTALQADIGFLSGTSINSATLSFQLKHGGGGRQNVTVTSFTADGTLEHFWTAPDNLGTTGASVTGLAVNSIDVTSLLQSRVNANAGWFGLHLQGSSLNQWTYTYIGFGNTADEAEVRLTIDYTARDNGAVPELASLAVWGLFACVATGGYGLRRYVGRRQ